MTRELKCVRRLGKCMGQKRGKTNKFNDGFRYVDAWLMLPAVDETQNL